MKLAEVKELVGAIESGSVERVRALLVQGVKPNGMDESTGDSPLATAAQLGHLAIVHILLDAGADPNYKRTVTPPLIAAAGNGHLEIVELLLACGAEVDVRDEGGGTALMDAAAAGHLKIVQRLLAAGANPKARDRAPSSAVVYAAEKGHREIVDLLAPLSAPAMREQALRTLHQAEHPPHPRTRELMKVIFSAKWENLQGELADVKRLIEEGIPSDGPDQEGCTPLMHAASKDRLEIVKYLVDLGANVNGTDLYGNCPLTFAAAGGRSGTYEYLYALTERKHRKRAEHLKNVHIHNGTWR